MSDNDVQDMSDTSNDEDTIEFSESHFDEPGNDTPADETETPAEPAPDAPEKEAETTEDAAEADKPDEAESLEESVEDKPDEVTEDKSEVDLKVMSRAERAEYFRDLKQQQTREVAEVIDQNYQPQPIDDLRKAYLDTGGYTEFEATMLAKDTYRDQQLQIAEAKTEISELNSSLRVDAIEAQSKYDWMNPGKTDAYDKDLHELSAQIFAQGVTTDPRTGQIIDTRMTPMQAAEIVDKIRNSGSANASIKAQKAAEQQMAAVAPSSSKAPPADESIEDKQASGLERALNNTR